MLLHILFVFCPATLEQSIHSLHPDKTKMNNPIKKNSLLYILIIKLNKKKGGVSETPPCNTFLVDYLQPAAFKAAL